MYENCLRNDYSDVIELRERFSGFEIPKITEELPHSYPENEATRKESMEKEEDTVNLLQSRSFDSHGTPVKKGDERSVDTLKMETEDEWQLVGPRRPFLHR